MTKEPSWFQTSTEDITRRLHFLTHRIHARTPAMASESIEVAAQGRPNDSLQLTLDLNTVNKYLSLSEGNTLISKTDTVQPYPDHPDRFDDVPQVLCKENVGGSCYWEVEWSGEYVSIAVSYKSISRKGNGNECKFGCNDKSWSLDCTPSKYSFWYKNIKTDLPVKPQSCKIRVYVDVKAGILSFYSVTDTMSLIHTVKTTFTETLCPGFWFKNGSVKLFINQ
ncbi:stonustoxin subunit alpha-like [Chanodichthys erythropterus]|uniref:stonustoxin subunit alpha-like n=1 Tax=Chanodichthys erythropterus TaxID=933992 RepID=UPI00351EE9CE